MNSNAHNTWNTFFKLKEAYDSSTISSLFRIVPYLKYTVIAYFFINITSNMFIVFFRDSNEDTIFTIIRLGGILLVSLISYIIFAKLLLKMYYKYFDVKDKSKSRITNYKKNSLGVRYEIFKKHCNIKFKGNFENIHNMINDKINNIPRTTIFDHKVVIGISAILVVLMTEIINNIGTGKENIILLLSFIFILISTLLILILLFLNSLTTEKERLYEFQQLLYWYESDFIDD